MHETVKQMAQNFSKQRTLRRRAYAAFTALALVVSISTMYTLSQPAQTMTGDPVCGMAEHVHSDACYTMQLVCGVDSHAAPEVEEVSAVEEPAPAESDVHEHDDSCYEQQEVLVCTLEEAEAHTHGDSCYGLSCGEDEYEAHTHGAECYQTRRELSCGEEEYEAHTHGAECYTTYTEQTCGEDEYEAHSHGSDCYTTSETLTCSEDESSGHSHSDGCYTEETELTCSADEGPGHTHSDSCYTEYTELTCSAKEGAGHSHSDSCYTDVEELTCSLQDGPGHTHSDACNGLVCGLEETEGHTHGDGCYEMQDVLVCTAGEEADTSDDDSAGHTESCYERVLTCGLEEHTHSSSCYEVPETVAPGADTGETICGQEEHTHEAACYDGAGTLICGLTEHTHSDECYPVPERMMVLPEGAEVPEGYDHEYTYISEDATFGVAVYAPEGAIPEGAALVAEVLAEDSDAYIAAGEALDAMMAEQAAVEEEATEEPAAEEVTESESTEEPAEEGAESETPEAPVVEEPAGEEAPEETKPYDGYVAMDIRFEDADGYEVEPLAPVYVCINALGLLPEEADPASVSVQHHAEVEPIATFSLRSLFVAPAEPEIVVTTVADAAEDTGIVQVTENEEYNAQDVATAFAVSSFSTFTITFTDMKEYNLGFTLRDTSGSELNIDASQYNLTYALSGTGESSRKTILEMVKANDLKTVVGTNGKTYEYQRALFDDNGILRPITAVQCIGQSGFIIKQYNVYFYDESIDNGFTRNLRETTPAVQLIYREVDGSNDSVVTETEMERTKTATLKENGNYELELTLSGAVGNISQKQAVDVVIIVDQSGSMDDSMSSSDRTTRSKAVYDAVTSLTSTLSGNENLDVRYGVATFAGAEHGGNTGIYQSLYWHDGLLKQYWTTDDALVNAAANVQGEENGGTNYQAGLMMAQNLLIDARANAQKYVIFLSDGKPTFYYDAEGKTQGNGSSTGSYETGAAYTQAEEFTSLNGFYSIRVGDESGADTILQTVCDHAYINCTGAIQSNFKNYAAADVDTLTSVFEQIQGNITQLLCSNVTMTDTLSDYVQVIEGGTPILAITDDNGDAVNAATEGVTTSYNSATKQLRVDFPDDYTLKAGYTYKVVIEIEPTEAAYAAYAANGYTNTGDAATGTHADDLGLYSNTEAKVTYTYKETAQENLYPMPVVQLDVGEFLIEKEIYGLETEEELNDLLGKITFQVKSGSTVVQTIAPVLTGNGTNAIATSIEQNGVTVGTKLTIDSVSISPGTYVVTESNYDKVGTKVWDANGSVKNTQVTVTKGGSATASLVNNYKLGVGDLAIHKTVMLNGKKADSGIFTFNLTATSGSSPVVGSFNLEYIPEDSPEDSTLSTKVTFDDEGKATDLKIPASSTVTIKDLPIGAIVTVEETGYDGYAPSWYTSANSAVNHSATAQANVASAEVVTIYFTNTTGTELPSTGGIGTHSFAFLGTMLMLSAGVLLLIQRRRREAT